MIKHLSIIGIILLAFQLTGLGQSITVSGTLVDSESGEPLVFASIGVSNAKISTVSNSLGKFDFHIPGKLLNEKLIISMMGYHNTEVPVRNLVNRDSVIFKLNKAVKLLDEVVIQDSLKGGDIARIAVSRIADNYPMEPFLMEGFYRDLKKLGGTYFSLLEAAVKIYDENYDNPLNKNKLRERVGLTEVRKSLGYNNKFIRYFDQKNLLENLLLENDIRYHKFPELTDSFFERFQRIKITYFNEHRVYVVEQRTTSAFDRMYIDTESYAVIRMEHEQYFDEKVLKKQRKMVSKQISEKKVIDFKEYEGKMYLNYMTMESKVNWMSEKTDQLKFETEVIQELLINRVDSNTTTDRIGNTHKMRRYGLQYQDEKYNQDFWDNYNVIKDTPLNDAIVADLEKSGALDYQFQEY